MLFYHQLCCICFLVAMWWHSLIAKWTWLSLPLMTRCTWCVAPGWGMTLATVRRLYYQFLHLHNLPLITERSIGTDVLVYIQILLLVFNHQTVSLLKYFNYYKQSFKFNLKYSVCVRIYWFLYFPMCWKIIIRMWYLNIVALW